MLKKKVFIHVLGARPNFIKASPIFQALNQYNIDNHILHTGQHYDFGMSEQFFDELSLPKPFHNLNIGSHSHGTQTGRMLEGVEKTLINNKVDYVVTYGDTNSTVAGALAAVKLNIPVAHIEGGVRTKNIKSPEEINRRICDHISSINFAPTVTSNNNLLNEGIPMNKTLFSGDVMFDMVVKTKRLKPLSIDIPENFVLATIHRQENTDNLETLKSIFNSLINLSSNISILMPLHPRTKNKMVEADIYNKIKGKIKLIDPQGYRSLLFLIKASKLVVSDSGGVPKEAAFLGKQSIFIGENIVWSELLDQKWTKLVQPKNIDKLEFFFKKIIKKEAPSKLSSFGDGKASVKIADFLSRV